MIPCRFFRTVWLITSVVAASLLSMACAFSTCEQQQTKCHHHHYHYRRLSQQLPTTTISSRDDKFSFVLLRSRSVLHDDIIDKETKKDVLDPSTNDSSMMQLSGARWQNHGVIQDDDDDVLHSTTGRATTTSRRSWFRQQLLRSVSFSSLSLMLVGRTGTALPGVAVAAAAAATIADSNIETQSQQQQQQEKDDALVMYKLPSGIKYIDLEPGTGPTPQYGQLVSFEYTGYIKLPASAKNPSPQPQSFDHDPSFLIKHGSGRTVPGLDEGLHGMRVGGTRRIIIPPKLGYISAGLGPIPSAPWDRWRLNTLLDQMVAMAGGTLIFEVRLLSTMDDEADQGYYQDTSLTPEQFDTLRTNMQRKAAEAAAAQKAAMIL